MHFSPSTLGFYPDFVEYPNLPDDLIEVSEELWHTLMGKDIEMGPDGMPRERVATPTAPTSVTMRQARLALLHAQKLGMVEAALAALPDTMRDAARIDWEFAATVDRNSPTVAMLSQALGMTSVELDQLFTLAATL